MVTPIIGGLIGGVIGAISPKPMYQLPIFLKEHILQIIP